MGKTYKTASGRKCAATARARRKELREPFYAHYTKRARKAFRESGLTVEDVARKSGLPERQIRRYLEQGIPAAGAWRFSINAADALSQGLGVDLGYFAEGLFPRRGKRIAQKKPAGKAKRKKRAPLAS